MTNAGGEGPAHRPELTVRDAATRRGGMLGPVAVLGGAAVLLGASLGAAALAYLRLARTWCLTWGATEDDATGALPGDELLEHPDIVSTRAITIEARPEDVWPWLMQMGSGKGGVYTYDWIENLLGLDMHSVNEVLPEFQDRKVGDVEPLGKKGPRLRVDKLEEHRCMVLHSEDANWVWAFVLEDLGDGRTRLISRNRIATPQASVLQHALNTLVMEPGSLIMERKMLLGIRQRAEALALERVPV